MVKKAILIFGVGVLQQSIIQRAQKMELFVVGIDPCKDAYCKDVVDKFEIVGGQDYEKTLAVAKKYNVSAVVTAATDKPLVMMARVAKELNLPFYSQETAEWSTDKYQMKQRFLEKGVPCAQGRLINRAEEANDLYFPVICKPRDNSGSRGVKLCRDLEDLQACIDEALQYSKLDTVLIEEFIEGCEFSIESLHYDGKSEVIQFTEKKTTEFPYNVELGHIQPANITEEQKEKISEIVALIGKTLHFENCPSHTELKINERGIFVIETSPRLGGDYITSTLTPLSTGINLEDQLLHIALGNKVDTATGRVEKASSVIFFNLPLGEVKSINLDTEKILSNPQVVSFSLDVKEGDEIKPITSSFNRYGQVIVKGENREEVLNVMNEIENNVCKSLVYNFLTRINDRLLIIGSGVFAKRVIEIIEAEGKYQILGLIDGFAEKGTLIEGYPVLGNDEDAIAFYKEGQFDVVFICVGYAQLYLKEKLYKFYIGHNIPLATIIHPTAVISPTAQIGQGVIICEGAIICKEANVMDCAVVKPGVLISHNSTIGRYSFVAGKTAIADFCHIGESCFIGINSTIKDSISIASHTIVGAGGLVVKDITESGTYVGCPVKKIS